MALINPLMVKFEESNKTEKRGAQSKRVLEAAQKILGNKKTVGEVSQIVADQRKKTEKRKQKTFATRTLDPILGEKPSSYEIKKPDQTRRSLDFRQTTDLREETVTDVLKNSKISLDKESIEKLLMNPRNVDYPEKPHFPIIIFSLAVIKDILDIPLNVGIVTTIAASVFSFFIAAVIFFWGFMKTNRWQRKLFKGFIKRWASMCIVEIIPGFQMIPATAIFVILSHFREAKFVSALLKIKS